MPGASQKAPNGSGAARRKGAASADAPKVDGAAAEAASHPSGDEEDGGANPSEGSSKVTPSKAPRPAKAPTPLKVLEKEVAVDERQTFDVYEDKLGTGAGTQYALREAREMLGQLTGLSAAFAGGLDELHLLDVLRLARSNRGGLVAVDDDPRRRATQLALLQALRATQSYKAWKAAAVGPDAPPFATVAGLDELAEAVPHYAKTSVQERVAVCQAAARDAAKPAAPAGDAGGQPPVAPSMNYADLAKAIAAGLASQGGGVRDGHSREADAKVPPSRVVVEVCTEMVRLQLQGSLPTTQMVPTEVDVMTAYETLTANPGRVPRLEMLSLPRPGDPVKAKPRTGQTYRHARAQSIGAEYQLLERYMLAVGWAAASPAGSYFAIDSAIDGHSQVYVRGNNALAVYARNATVMETLGEARTHHAAAAARRAVSAAADTGSADDDDDEDYPDPEEEQYETEIIGLFTQVLLFTASCRAAGYESGLSAHEARLHVDRVIEELDSEMYKNNSTLTVAMVCTEKLRLAAAAIGSKQHDKRRRERDESSSGSDSDDSHRKSNRKSARKARGADRGNERSRGQRDQQKPPPKRADTPPKKGICHPWAKREKTGAGKGCSSSAKDCRYRHVWKNGERATY